MKSAPVAKLSERSQVRSRKGVLITGDFLKIYVNFAVKNFIFGFARIPASFSQLSFYDVKIKFR